MVEVLQSATSQLSATYVKVWDSGTTHRPTPFLSCADYQLKREAYLPCRPSFAHPDVRAVPRDLYWPDRGLAGVTPMLDLGSFPVGERNRLKSFLVSQLKLQEKLPEEWEPWLSWAESLADYFAEGGQIPERAVRHFYEAFVTRRFLVPQPRTPKFVVAVTKDGLAAVPAKNVVWIDDPRVGVPEVYDALVAAKPVFPPMLTRGDGSVQRLKVCKASELISVTPAFLDAPDETARLEGRLRLRRRALAAVCENKGEKWTDPGALRAVRGLSLTLQLDDQVISSHAASSFRNEGVWLVNLDAGLGVGLAAACADRFRSAADLRYWFAAILKASNSHEVIAILRDGGIPGYRLQEISLDDDDRAPEFAALTVPSSVAPTEVGSVPSQFDLPPDDDGFEEDNSESRPASGSPQGDRRHMDISRAGHTGSPIRSGVLRKRSLFDGWEGGRSVAGGPARAIATAAAVRAKALGHAGEAWFDEALQETIPTGWSPRFNARDSENRESDVELTSPAGGAWHIEIKTLATERIYWSELERRKAEAHAGRYFMACLVPQADGAYKVYWSWDPLKDLLACERRVEWVWAASEEGPPLLSDSWKPLSGLKRPERPPDQMSFAIRVEQNFLDGLRSEGDKLALLWDRVAAVENAAEKPGTETRSATGMGAHSLEG